jgi:site-specific DNA-methyltransferase (adenine-specific)
MIELLHIDCMEYMATCKDKQFDLAVVDPPYGLGTSVVNSSGRFKRYENKNGNWDLQPPTKEYFKELFRVSKEQIIWGGNYFDLPPNKCFLIFDKMQPQDISFAMCEYAWASFDKVAQIFKCRIQNQEQRFHPTQKPIRLYDWIFNKYATQGMTILDTHLGSGSSAIAAHYAGLNFVGCELDKEYYDAACKRFKEQTQQQKLF